MARVADNRSAGLLELRRTIFERLAPARHHRILDLRADDGLLLWEALRRAPEGGVTGLVGSGELREQLEHYAGALDMAERPKLTVGHPGDHDAVKSLPHRYDRITGRNCAIREADKRPFLRSIGPLMETGAAAVIAEAIPRRSPRITELAEVEGMSEEAAELLRLAEQLLYDRSPPPLLAWDGEDLRRAAEQEGFNVSDLLFHRLEERRLIRAAHIDGWISAQPPAPPGGGEPEAQGVGDGGGHAADPALIDSLSQAVRAAAAQRHADENPQERMRRIEELRGELHRCLADRTVLWPTVYAVLTLTRGGTYVPSGARLPHISLSSAPAGPEIPNYPPRAPYKFDRNANLAVYYI
jgi:hypothetical protein